MKVKTKVKSVCKMGKCEIFYATDNFGNWNYTLMSNNQFVMRSYDFNKCKEYALKFCL